jgi:MazG family protein
MRRGPKDAAREVYQQVRIRATQSLCYITCMSSHDDPGKTTGEKFERAVAIMARLRAPGGCPWDREQTFDTIKPYTLEETYEVLDAIDARDWEELPGELGDLLLQVLFYAQMANEEKRFSVNDVLDRLSNKLVARHPHVFGDVKAETPKEVLRNWEALKAEEKRQSGDQEKKRETLLGGISSAMPALMEAYKISSRAANVGFDWPNIEGLFDKLSEETAELRHEIAQMPNPPSPHGTQAAGARGSEFPEELRARLEDEVGDMFFVLVNIARYLSLDPESALRKTNRKFRQRFAFVEETLHAQGKRLQDATLEEMEAAWQKAKSSG